MKKIIVSLLVCGSFLFGGCSSKDELNGSYELNNGYGTAEVEIDGNDALMSLGGQAMNGEVNRSDKTITFKDGKETEKFEYKLVGDKLSLSNDDDTLAFEKKTSNKEAKSTKKTKDSSEIDDSSSNSDSENNNNYSYEDYFSLSTGEYEVGSDIKPGAYNVDFSFYDFSDEGKEDGTGYIEVTHDKDVKKHEFANDGAERRIILKDGDLINCVPENSDSDFNFAIE